MKNGAPFIRASINSVISICPSAAIIAVDDGSTDGTLAILDKLSSNLPNLLVLPTPGICRAAALSLALAAVTTPFLSNMDADNALAPLFPTLITALKSSPESVAVIFGKTKILLDQSPVIHQEQAEEVDQRDAGVKAMPPLYRGTLTPT